MTDTMASPATPSERMMLLSLDGGGVKGISSLLILDRLMKKLREELIKRGGQHDLPTPEPWQVFDLAGGTSTGGLIALMLFRLRLSTETAITKFKKIAEDLFSPHIGPVNLHDFGDIGYWLGNAVLKAQALISDARFPSEPLETAIDELLEASVFETDRKLKGKSPLLNDGTRGRM